MSVDSGTTTDLKTWVLLRLNRWLLTGAILAGAFVVLIVASQFGLSPLRTIVERQNGVWFLFSSFIGAIITGTSIVVTINQLVLSQELGAVGDQRSRMQESMAFRQDVEATIDEEEAIAPEPAAFLFELVDGIERQARHLEDTMEDERDEEVQETIDEYVTELTENAESVKDGFEGAQFGTFEVIWAALNFNYSRKIYDARQIRDKYADSLSADATDALDEMVDTLTFFGPAREHFKTLYFQWELINLSRALLYIAVPALVVIGMLLMYIGGNTLPGRTLGVDNLVWVVSSGFVVGISPFVLFITYIIRIDTIAKQTLAMGPFILEKIGRERDQGS